VALPASRVYAGRAETTIGRQPDRQIYIDDRNLSRQHASLYFSAAGEIGLRDHGSHNGSHVNGARVTDAPVRPGDVIRCGTTLLLVVADVAGFRRWPEAATASPLWGGPAIEAVRQQLDGAAREGIEVLLQGESGTGKEVAARLLHLASGRAGAFVPVNCAAMPQALFEAELFGADRGAFTGADQERPGLMRAAAGGTLFLDEVGELPPELQPKLLRAVELREVRPVGGDRVTRVDLQLVAATNRDLRREVARGRFRGDLFHRLCGVVIELPPLRARREDILLLARRYLEGRESGEPLAMSCELVERLLLHAWPGNVRELERTLREAALQASIAGDTRLEPGHLRAELRGEDPSEASRGEASQDETFARVREALIASGGNVSEAASALGIPRGQIYNLLRVHGLSAEDFR
jgi:transcriptional regulator with GAF, ATPase, and Fis domain